MSDFTRRVVGLKKDYSDFWKQCKADMEEKGPERLREREGVLEQKVEALGEEAEQATAEAKKTVLKLLKRHCSDADEGWRLEYVAEAVAEGAPYDYGGPGWRGEKERLSFEDALKTEIDRNPPEDADMVRLNYTGEVQSARDLRTKAERARNKLRLVRYAQDDWASEGSPADEDKGRGYSEEELQELFHYVVQEIGFQNDPSNFKYDLCAGAAKSFNPEGKPNAPGVHSQIKDHILPLLQEKDFCSDLDLPDNLAVRTWTRKEDDLLEAARRWVETLQSVQSE